MAAGIAAVSGSGLPAGTRVQLRDGNHCTGTVISYHPEYSIGRLGLFSVRLDNGIWQICDTRDVIVMAPPKQTDQVAADYQDTGT